MGMVMPVQVLSDLNLLFRNPPKKKSLEKNGSLINLRWVVDSEPPFYELDRLILMFINFLNPELMQICIDT